MHETKSHSLLAGGWLFGGESLHSLSILLALDSGRLRFPSHGHPRLFLSILG